MKLCRWIRNDLEHSPTPSNTESPKSHWLVVWNMLFICPSIGNVIIPIDFHMFSEGVGIPTTNHIHRLSIDYPYTNHRLSTNQMVLMIPFGVLNAEPGTASLELLRVFNLVLGSGADSEACLAEGNHLELGV